MQNLKPQIERSDFIVDVCIYEREWNAPTEGMHEGTFIERAVVTGVLKGNISIGTKIEMQTIAVNPPNYFKNFRTVVEGELETLMFSPDIVQRFKDGKYFVFAHYKFNRCKGKIAEAFQKELKTNPVFRRESESGPRE